LFFENVSPRLKEIESRREGINIRQRNRVVEFGIEFKGTVLIVYYVVKCESAKMGTTDSTTNW
jgi:hypothetical protein